jgi:hypothetical protein
LLDVIPEMLSFKMRLSKYFYDKPLPKYLDPKTVQIYRPHPVYQNPVKNLLWLKWKGRQDKPWISSTNILPPCTDCFCLLAIFLMFPTPVEGREDLAVLEVVGEARN